MKPPASLRSRVIEAARHEPSPPRDAVRARNAALLVSGLVLPLLVFLAFGGPQPLGRPETLMAETAIGALAIAATALIVVLRRGRSTLGRPGVYLLAIAVLTPAVLFAWKIGVSASVPGMTEAWPDRAGFRCLRLSCLMVAWPLVALVLTRRGADPMHPRLTGAAIGATAGACVWVLVDLWCPVAFVPHLLMGHVLPIVAATLLGAWLGGRVIAVRR